MALITIITWILFGCMAALSAKNRGRSPYGWFFIGAIGGVFGLILLFLLPPGVPLDKESADASVPEKLAQSEEYIPSRDWFYLDSHKQQCGPIGMHDMKALWDKGELTMKSWVWHETLVNWDRIENIATLLEKLSKPTTESK